MPETATICLRPLQVDSIFVFIHQVAVLFGHDSIFVFIRRVPPVPACWLFKTWATSWPNFNFTNTESGVRDICDVGYLCAIFFFLGPCSRLRPDIRDRRQTDRRQRASSLNASALWGGGIIKSVWFNMPRWKAYWNKSAIVIKWRFAQRHC